MYLYKKEAEKLLKESHIDIVSNIREKFEFFLVLFKEADWSFVIKAHIMIEAAITEMIIQHLGEEPLNLSSNACNFRIAEQEKLRWRRALGF